MSEGRINIIDATPIEASQSGSGNDKDGKTTKILKMLGIKNDCSGKKNAI